MNWYPNECKYGDIIRVNLGSLYHYGIFVDEDNIIQFGLPPIPENMIPSEEIVVCSSDIDTFSCGKIVETAVFTKKENKEKFNSKEIVKRATDCLGNGGYSLLHNNCEHFVYYCAFDKHYCSVEAEAVNRWKNRPIFDIYIMPIKENTVKESFSCQKRMSELNKIHNKKLLCEKRATWTLLEIGINHSIRKNTQEINFSKNVFGKWSADCVSFSLSHSNGFAVAVVSNSNCGVDFEIASNIKERFSTEQLARLKNKIKTESEDNFSFISLWTKKESLFKLKGSGFFSPKQIDTNSDNLITEYLNDFDMVLSYCGESVNKARKFVVLNNEVKLLNGVGEKI